jgi:Meckel syndrome type 1 protein
MNTPLPPDHDNDDLPGEAELSALYRKLPRSEPGQALDAAVLRAAAEALSGKNTAATSYPQARASRTRWLIPLSSAATLVLAAGLAWHMRSMPAVESARTMSAAPTEAPSDAATPVAPPSAAAPAPPAQAQAQSTQSEAVLDEVVQAPRQPAPALRKLDRPTRTIASMKPKKTTVDGNLETSALANVDARQSADETMMAPALLPERYAPAEAPASPEPSPVAEAGASSDKAAAIGNEAEMSRAAPVRMAAPAPMVAAAPAAVGAISDTAKDARDAPAQELDKIRQLFAAHRDDEARTRLKLFQHEHADQTLPTDLRARLRENP